MFLHSLVDFILNKLQSVSSIRQQHFLRHGKKKIYYHC
ncbi:hypothetical protein TCARB_1749 [Thermofilum adornatum 1505]|uniref:Uncharacterized protein n=1 Tax=Thermofilum adornatum 1505 TaxID=697581 RepID=A0A3G1AA14_9CREN|nr:hypothetical protein TCARB_1749 [Thermofilum adornatum 1505]